ncbi:MAG: glycosyltransferase family 4 protein [Ruminococcaceae bacterium]|nr:glycosyltransferase family 4 protein [Oscillospiraceae bacterium]
MPTVDILYSYFYDASGEKPTLGGIQTYILRLSQLCEKLGYFCRIFQFADKPFELNLSDMTKVIGIEVHSDFKRNCKKVTQKMIESRTDDRYLTLISSDTYITGKKIDNSLTIQHGIMWDGPRVNPTYALKGVLGRAWFSYKTIKRLSKVDKTVCVDYNFINWYRTQIWNKGTKLIPIPNFTEIMPFSPREKSDEVKIVFARRLFHYRGTRILAAVAERLFNENAKISVTFAGTGPDEALLKEKFKGNTKVSFTSYAANESLKFHQKFDIAVVPTTGSEGTSLSLLEAMSAGCAAVCTNVGGMTNIILSGYNGLMVNPNNEDELYGALVELINDPDKRNMIAKNGHESVSCAFSHERWEKEWTKVLVEMLSE